jgi:5-formyltetrahydrofolate cyclo-ligase
MVSKKELRRQIAQLKERCTPEERAYLSGRLLDVLEADPAFKTATTLLLYNSLPDEVNTHDFIRRWSREKRILLPVVKGEELELREYRGEEKLQPGSFGIQEPMGEAFTDYASIELAVIPGVAFDHQGNRLGRGKGYYDRLLPQLPSARKVGLCFPFQYLAAIPAEPFDVCMDAVITLP